jgi:hypothetical protein
MSVVQPIASTSTAAPETVAGPSNQPQPLVSDSTVPATAVPAGEEPRREQVQKVRSVGWGLKPVHWPPEQPKRVLRIITQNENGPCSFIAICTPGILKVHCISLMQRLGNILILRGEIVIMPPDRPSVSYEYLSTLLGDYLVNKSSDVDLDSVFSVLPKTQRRLFDDRVWAFSDNYPQMDWT